MDRVLVVTPSQVLGMSVCLDDKSLRHGFSLSPGNLGGGFRQHWVSDHT